MYDCSFGKALSQVWTRGESEGFFRSHAPDSHSFKYMQLSGSPSGSEHASFSASSDVNAT